jgi:hypothetical protein
MNTFPSLISQEHVARLLHIKPRTLRAWRAQDPTPISFIRVGKRALYPADAVLDYLERRKNGDV